MIKIIGIRENPDLLDQGGKVLPLEVMCLNGVEKYYDETCLEEWERLERHRIEFDITRWYMKEFIKPSSRILDVWGGPGRYSIFLAKEGHNLTLFDLSFKNIELAKQKAREESRWKWSQVRKKLFFCLTKGSLKQLEVS